ncbi:hypothetical protein AWC22_03540 [Mycobacterium riyadhense]|uniref:Uncharacterized protein n=1 Tax=Mycobacterium riyadhense TaxID=486698 RepID=A0A1X2BIM4_9MYCO|nr:hypothetical protein AWC22_03540 [Mycobacterium riyadhense]
MRISSSNATDLVLGLRRRQIPVDRRRTHPQQLSAHRQAVAVTIKDQLAVALQTVELQPHRRPQILPALPTRGSPHLQQHFERDVGIPARARLTRPFGHTAPLPGATFAAAVNRRRALSRDQPVTPTT